MTRRNLYYNYIGYPYSYEEQPMRQNAPLNANVAGFGAWLRYPFNKNKRINAGFQEDTGSFNAPITDYNTTGNGTTDWNSGFVTGQMQQEQFTRPQSNQLNLTMDYQSNTEDNPIVEMNSGNVKESNDNTQGFNIGGSWGNAIAPAATNIANAFLDTEASTADRVAGAMGIPVLAKQWTADTTKGDKYLKGLALQNTGIKKPNYIQDASSAWGANNAIKLNAQNNISPISSESALPSLKDFKGNWWRNTGAAVAQGAAAGSVGGPWGALGGAVTGLFGSIGGLFGRQKRANAAYKDFLARRDTLMSARQAQFNKANIDQTLSNMQALANGNMSQRINDMANIRAYGGNLFDDGGDLTDEQQMVLADIQADPRILFTPKYSQWRDYIRRTSPDYLDRLYTSLPYEQQQDIYQNDREAWGALSNEAKGNFGGAQVRKKTDEVSPYVAGALGLVGAIPAWEAVTMFPMLENGLNTYFGYEGAKNLPTAITDAYDYTKKGDWSRAGLSAGEAALDALFLGQGLKGIRGISNTIKSKPSTETMEFYHGGLDSDFDFNNLDVLKLAEKQAKRGKDYAGFYMYDPSLKMGAYKYGEGIGAHKINIDRNAKVLDLGDIERVPRTEIQKYKDLGYDMLTGKDVRGRREYVLLNKDAIKNTEYISPEIIDSELSSINNAPRIRFRDRTSSDASYMPNTSNKISDSDWDNAYNAAIKSNDIEKAQRLRDAHFLENAGSDAITKEGRPEIIYHSISPQYNSNFNSFDTKIEGKDTFVYTTNNKNMSRSYTKGKEIDKNGNIIENEHSEMSENQLKEAIKSEESIIEYQLSLPKEKQNPAYIKNVQSSLERHKKQFYNKKNKVSENYDADNLSTTKSLYGKLNSPWIIEGNYNNWSHIPTKFPEYNEIVPVERSTREVEDLIQINNSIGNKKYDGAIMNNISDWGSTFLQPERDIFTLNTVNPTVKPNPDFYGTVYSFENPKNLKYRDVITYDDSGNIIPLSKRDNFSINDLRYGLFPLLGLTSYGLVNNTEHAMGGNLFDSGGSIADLFQNAVQKSAFASLYDPYTIKRGETLSGIALRNNISLEDLINSNPEITNPSMINVGQQINLPIHFDNKEITDGVSDSLDTQNFLDYTVKQGDYMSKIAKSNNTTLDELQKANPQIKDFNRIFVGDIIHIPQNTAITAPAPKRMSLSERRTFEEEANKTNLGAIQGYRHDNNYAVIDKKNKTVTVYSPTNEVLYQSNEINTGLSGDDYNTITYTDKSGKIKNNEGNMSTPAGITEISEFGTYHNQPSYIRKRVGDETDIASSFHAGDIKKGSNGCVRMSDKTLQDLQQFLNKGTRVYTLPEKDGSRFVLKDGKLSFQADNSYGETDGSKKYWDDYNVYNDKTSGDLFISPNENFKNKYKDTVKLGNAVKFGNTLSENKEELQKYLGLSSGVYNDLAQLAMGIADQETKFGSSTKYSLKSNMPWLVNSAKWITNNNSANSQGITQIKYDADIRNEDLKKIYDDLGITKDSLQTPEGAAKATLARLAFIYKTEVLGKKFTGADDIEVSPLDALLYKYMGKNGELKNHTATPTLNQYIKNVNTYKNNFDYEGTFAMGGNLYTDLSPNMMTLWNNKQQIDQQKVNMQQMNFGLGNSFNQKLNTFDYGGSMNGMDLPTGMQSYENGGTHEQNPYGGIQVGVDQQGNPNLVEEGEFRWGDYVFSDRINVDPTLLSRYNLAPATKHQGKKANKGKLSYADMAKKYAKKNGELANDPIGKNTLEAYMKRLQDAQEDQKFQDSMEQQKQDAINQYRNALTTPQQGNPVYGAMKYNGMGNAATQQGVNAGMSDLGQQGGGNEVLSNTNRSGNNMLHAFGGNLFWDGGTPQIKPKLLNVNPNLVLGDNYMDRWTANNAGTPRLFSSTIPMYTGENPEANFTAYQKRYPTLPSDTKGMQQLLVNEGFDIGNTGPNKDGVDDDWGKKSQAAWYDFLRAYNHRPNTMNQYDLIGSNNQPSTSNSQASYNGGLNLGVRDGDATTDNNNLGDGQTSYNNAEGNTNTGRSNLTDGIKRDTTTTFGTAATKEDQKQVPHYSTAGEYAMFGKGFTPMLYDWMNKTNTKYDPNQRPAYELADMGNNSTFLRTADTIGGYRAPNLMDAERMNNAAQAQGIAALQAALNVGNGNRGFAAAQTAQNAYNTQMGIGNNYSTTQQINNDERFKNDSFNTALDQANANIRNSMYQDNQKARQIGQQMAIDTKKAANDYILRNELYADATNRQAMDNRAANQATWTDNALNYFIAQAQKNDILNAKNNDITNPYWTDKNGVMHYIGDSGLNSAVYDAFTSDKDEWGNYAVNNGTFSGDRLKDWNKLLEKHGAAVLAANPDLWKSLVLQEKQARKEEAEKAELAKTDRLNNQRYAFDNNMAQLNNYRTLYGDKFTDGQWYDDLMKRYNDVANAKEFNDVNNLEYWNRVIGDKLNYWQRYNTPVTANQSAYGGYINNNNKSNKREYYNYMRR